MGENYFSYFLHYLHLRLIKCLHKKIVISCLKTVFFNEKHEEHIYNSDLQRIILN